MQQTQKVWLYNVKLLYAACIFALLFSSCSYKQNQVLFERKTTAIDTANHGMIQPAAYKIKAQDVLQVRNLQNIKYITDEVPTGPSGAAPTSSQGGQMGQTYQVEEDGTVALPVIGRVQVAGLSRYEATKKIEEMYRKSLLKDPIIEVKIINLSVTLLGEVKSPGNYPLIKDRTGLVEMIGAAGGLTDKANEKTVKIIRGTAQNPKVTEIDMSDIASLGNPATVLQNQDIIYIAQNKKAIRNEKLQNFSLIAQPALLLLNTALIIFTLAK